MFTGGPGGIDRARRLLVRCDPPGADWLRWIDAYAALCRGDFATADRAAAEISTGAPDAAVRCAALMTLGSSARQAGRHGEGRIHDIVALGLAVTPSQQAHALIGLAADAVGLGEVDACAQRLAEATAIAPARERRAQVRLSWVRCEHALLVGAPGDAVEHARRALRQARRLRSHRHRAKSMLFLGVALEAARQDAGARLVLRRTVRMTTGRRGCEPLLEVAHGMLARIESRSGPAG